MHFIAVNDFNGIIHFINIQHIISFKPSTCGDKPATELETISTVYKIKEDVNEINTKINIKRRGDINE